MDSFETKPVPPGRGKDELSQYLSAIYSNQFATFANKRTEYQLLSTIDKCFHTIGSNQNHPKVIVPLLLFFGSHAAYRATCQTSLAGQVAVAFALMRVCLESAGYALRIFKEPSLGEVWLNRHDNPAAFASVLREFKSEKVETTIGASDSRLKEKYKELYQRTIDFGGHPNERSIIQSLTVGEEVGSTTIENIYLHGDTQALMHGLKSAAQSGLCALQIFQFIFSERFLLLGVQNELATLRLRL